MTGPVTDPRDPDLQAVDEAARAASRGLRDHVSRRVDPELLLAALPAAEPPRRHGRILAAAAVAALFFGSVAVLGDGPGGDERSRLELDEDGNKLPAPEPGALTPLGPNDGLDSIQLPITVEPNVDLRDGDTVTASGPGFVPGEQVGIVQCAREAGGEAREQRAGIDACTIGTVQYADADDDGRGHRHLHGAADPHDTGHRHGGLCARGGALHRRDGRHRRLRPVGRLRRRLRGRRRADRRPCPQRRARRRPGRRRGGPRRGRRVRAQLPLDAERLLDRSRRLLEHRGAHRARRRGRASARAWGTSTSAATPSPGCSPTPRAASARTCRCGGSFPAPPRLRTSIAR